MVKDFTACGDITCIPVQTCLDLVRVNFGKSC